MAAAAEGAKKKERKEAPQVRARSRGQVSNTLENFADRFRSRHPSKDVRYVYDPTHRPELSGVMGREALGYEIVTYEQLGLAEGEKEKAKSPVRVGDLVLMSIGKEQKAAIRAERQKWAQDRAESVQREFYSSVNEAARQSTPSHHSGPAAKPIGRASIEQREVKYDIEQREE